MLRRHPKVGMPGGIFRSLPAWHRGATCQKAAVEVPAAWPQDSTHLGTFG